MVIIMDLLILQNKVTEIVQQAADKYFSIATTVIEKDGAANIVTDADLNVQQFLMENLKDLLPCSSFLCEENDVVNTNTEFVWIIDPIDGTTNFARGLYECAISVGLLQNGDSVLGVVYAPRLNLLFSATKGGGAFCNGNKIHTSTKNFSQSILCTAFCLYRKEFAKPCANVILEALPLCNDVRRFGSCAFELCLLACGKCDLFFEYMVFPWDYAGAYLILTEAGGIISGYNKQQLDFKNQTTIIAANNILNFEKLNDIVLNNITNMPTFKEEK